MNKAELFVCAWLLLAIFLDCYGDKWTRNLMGEMPTIVFDFKGILFGLLVKMLGGFTF